MPISMKRFALACLLCLASLPAFAQNAWSIVPTGYDYISMGVPRTLDSTNGVFYLDWDPNLRRVYAKAHPKDLSTFFELQLGAPVGETLRPGRYFYTDSDPARGRAPFMTMSGGPGGGHACNESWGWFNIRQIAYDANGKIFRLEANGSHVCDGDPPLGFAVIHNAPQLHFAVGAPDFARTGKTYYGDTTIFSLVNSNPGAFQYAASGLRDKWTMNLAAPVGQAQFGKGMYLTQATPATGVAGMDIALGTVRKSEYGKFEILSVNYRSGQIVQLSARWYFYSDEGRTTLLRSGRINYWR